MDVEVKIPTDFEKKMEILYQELIQNHIQKDPVLFNSIRILLHENPEFKIDPKFGLTLKHIKKLADDLVTRDYKDRPEILEYFDRIRGTEIKNLVQSFADDLRRDGFEFKALEFHPNRIEKTHLEWLRQQGFMALDPPLAQKKDDKVGLPILLVFDQFRNDFNFLIEVFFKPYIKNILNQDPEDLYYREILTEVMKEEDSLWKKLSVENFSIIRNSIVRSHFFISPDLNINFFSHKKGLTKKIRLKISNNECLLLATILNQSIWILILRWIQTFDLEKNHPISELKDQVEEIMQLWMNHDLLKKRLDHFAKTQFGKAVSNREMDINLSIGRYNPTINRKMKLNYLKESAIYFLGCQGSQIKKLFRHSLEASNRIAYMNVYNITWTEYLLPIGKWLISKQGSKHSRNVDLWNELRNYFGGKYKDLFQIFSPIIRNAIVHGEYYQKEDRTYLFYSADYPEYSPISVRPASINLFQLKHFFDQFLHPHTVQGFEKFGIAKYWLEILNNEEKSVILWQRQIDEMEKLGYSILGVLMRVKLISTKFSGDSLNNIKEDIDLLFKDKLVVINNQNIVALVLVSLFLYNKEKKQVYLIMEQVADAADEFFLLNPKIKALMYEIQIFLAKKRKAWKEVKNLQTRLKKVGQ